MSALARCPLRIYLGRYSIGVEGDTTAVHMYGKI